MFEKLLLDLHSVLDRARGMIREYEQKIQEVKDQKALNEQVNEKLDLRAAGLQDREVACAKVENVLKLHKEATDLHASATSRLQEAVEAEKGLKQHNEESMNNIREANINSQKIADANLKRSKQMDDEVTKRVTEICKKYGLNIGG